MIEKELEKLKREVENCKKCPLWKNRYKSVFGEGPFDAKIMLVGLGPGKNENLQGRPFVGAAGRFLNYLLRVAGLQRQEVYITNVVKCYVPDNNPTEEEINACIPYLSKQIELIRPKVIISMGRVALTFFSKKFGIEAFSLMKEHGKLIPINTLNLRFKLFLTLHPASALYNPNMRDILIEDWKKVRKLVAEICGIEIREEVQAVIKIDGKVIIVKKNGEWRLLKGGINPFETAEEALKRELNEELNIEKFRIVKKVDYCYAFKTKTHLHSVDNIFLIEISEKEEIEADKKELENYRIVEFKEALEMLRWNEEKEVLKKAFS